VRRLVRRIAYLLRRDELEEEMRLHRELAPPSSANPARPTQKWLRA
jgi:hypothetical protein